MPPACLPSPEVREFLLNTQRDMAKNGNILMDGRDIGTVILPDAPVKIFLTASAESRAERRYKELAEKGQQVTMESVLHDINERDRQDMNRAHRAAAAGGGRRAARHERAHPRGEHRVRSAHHS